MLSVGSQVILAIDLILLAIHGATASPNVDMVEAVPIVPVGGTLIAFVLHSDVLLQVWNVQYFAHIEFARSSREGKRIAVSACSTGDVVATTTVVGGSRSCRAVVGISVEGVFDRAHVAAGSGGCCQNGDENDFGGGLHADRVIDTDTD